MPSFRPPAPQTGLRGCRDGLQCSMALHPVDGQLRVQRRGGSACRVGALLAFIVGVLRFLKAQGGRGGGDGDDEQPQHLGVGVPARGLNRPGALRRRRRAAAAAAAAAEDAGVEGDDDEDERHDREDAAPRAPTARDAYEARRAARDAEREAQEAAQEEEIRRAAEERRRRDEEEAARWMHTFTVEAAGEEALSQEDGEALEARFVDYIRRRKTVALDELAAEFGMRTQEVIARVQGLEAAGDLTGVMDDRGKFIFISPEEMHAFADFIRQRGRIAIAELAAKSNQFVDLEAKDVGAAADLALPTAGVA